MTKQINIAVEDEEHERLTELALEYSNKNMKVTTVTEYVRSIIKSHLKRRKQNGNTNLRGARKEVRP